MRRLREGEKFTESDKLSFDEMVLKERWEYITTYEGLPVFDVEHAFEQFANRHPTLEESDLLDILFDGIDTIKKDYGLKVHGQYMIISKSMDVKIALEVRPDRYKPQRYLGAVPTVLDKKAHPFNLRNEIEILVEESRLENKYAIGSYAGTNFYEVIQEGERLYRYDRVFVR